MLLLRLFSLFCFCVFAMVSSYRGQRSVSLVLFSGETLVACEPRLLPLERTLPLVFSLYIINIYLTPVAVCSKQIFSNVYAPRNH